MLYYNILYIRNIIKNSYIYTINILVDYYMLYIIDII